MNINISPWTVFTSLLPPGKSLRAFQTPEGAKGCGSIVTQPPVPTGLSLQVSPIQLLSFFNMFNSTYLCVSPPESLLLIRRLYCMLAFSCLRSYLLHIRLDRFSGIICIFPPFTRLYLSYWVDDRLSGFIHCFLFEIFFSISYPNTIICGNTIFSPHETLLLFPTLTNSCCQWTPLLFPRLLFCLLTLKIVACMNMGRDYFSVTWITCQWLYRLKKWHSFHLKVNDCIWGNRKVSWAHPLSHIPLTIHLELWT